MGKSISNLVYIYITGPIFLTLYCIYTEIPDLSNHYLCFWGLSALGYFVTDMMIPRYMKYALRANLFGMDINKKGTEAGKVKM